MTKTKVGEQETGVVTYIYRDGNEIRLNIIDENSSILITFSSDEQFKNFARIVAEARQKFLGASQ